MELRIIAYLRQAFQVHSLPPLKPAIVQTATPVIAAKLTKNLKETEKERSRYRQQNKKPHIILL